MPIMDGFAATRLIRDHEARVGLPRTPIIALTANALTGDREHCIANGMDDYLSKPIELRQLSLLVAKWLGPTKKQKTPSRRVRSTTKPRRRFGPREVKRVQGPWPVRCADFMLSLTPHLRSALYAPKPSATVSL